MKYIFKKTPAVIAAILSATTLSATIATTAYPMTVFAEEYDEEILLEGEEPAEGENPGDGETPTDGETPDGETPADGDTPSDGGEPADGETPDGEPTVIDYSDVEQFPASYQDSLKALKDAHPTWTFVMMDTGLEWSTVIREEMRNNRSLVQTYFGPNWCAENYGSGWSVATQDAVEYCIDPRNWLSEGKIFMFEQLTYNAEAQDVDTTQSIIEKSFMNSPVPEMEITYAENFVNIGAEIGVSPYHLASRVLQEQGTKGDSPLISGTYPGYEGYYNYYNIGASGKTNTAIIESGLTRAQKEGWTSPYLSILGGANFISNSYILKGQDTMYLEKFDVDATYYGTYVHQYMQNILAPSSESTSVYKAYVEAEALEGRFVFKIPVYKNMPTKPCKNPDEKYKIPANITGFVTRLYQLVLEREPDEDGLEYWSVMLMNQEITGAEISEKFFLSDEMMLRNLSNEEYIKIAYRTLLNREAEEAGLGYWTSVLDKGVSYLYIVKGFAESEEFGMICTAYEIEQGSIKLTEARDRNENITAYVKRCYLCVLNRTYDVGGLNYWCDIILSAEDQRGKAKEVASEQFFHSEEFALRNTTNEEYVTILYNTFLGREPEEAGFNYWMDILSTGANTRDEVMDSFVNSEEFNLIMRSYGL